MSYVNSVSVSPKSTTIAVGKWFYDATAEVSTSNDSCKEVSWHSENPSIASVNESSGYICANAVGTTKIYATATDGSGCSDYLTVTVTPNIPVSSIVISSIKSTLYPGESMCVEAAVYPSNATNPAIKWSSDDTNVATVDRITGLVCAQNLGTTTIRATAQDGSGVVGTCSISVSAIPVRHISISPEQITLAIGETAHINAKIMPENAGNKTIIWTSSDDSVATVETYTGVVKAKSSGSAKITARTENGDRSDTCDITVIEKVEVIKDDEEYFHVVFQNNVVWKSIGCDLGRVENQSNAFKYYQDSYDNLHIYEQRYFDNTKKHFTTKQIAFLYLFDPLGIEYYVRNAYDSDMSLGEHLIAKDEIYEYIFGAKPRLFKENDTSGKIKYYTYPDSIEPSTRTQYFSEAEALFGAHVIPNWKIFEGFLSNVMDDIFDCGFFEALKYNFDDYKNMEEYLESMDDHLENAKTILNLVQAMFFEGSVKGIYSSAVSDFMTKAGAKFGSSVLAGLGWVMKILNILNTHAQTAFNEATLSELNRKDIYETVKNKEAFRTEFIVDGCGITIEDVIAELN